MSKVGHVKFTAFNLKDDDSLAVIRVLLKFNRIGALLCTKKFAKQIALNEQRRSCNNLGKCFTEKTRIMKDIWHVSCIVIISC